MNDDRIRRTVRLSDGDAEMEEELRFHFSEVVDELVAAGWARSAAEAEAKRRFGDEARYRRALNSIDRTKRARAKYRGVLSVLRMGTIAAWRSALRSPGMTAAIVLSFALGIGVNATMFGTIDRLLLRPPDGIRDAERVRRLHVDRFVPVVGERVVTETFTYPDFMDLRRTSGFAGVGGVRWDRMTAGRGENAEEIVASSVTGNAWSLLGVRPALGRFFSDAEDVRDGEPVAVLSWGYWQSRYGGDRTVLGRTLDLADGSFIVVGVAPQGFTGVDLTPVDIWLPMVQMQYRRQGDEWVDHRRWWWMNAFVRVSDGVSVERAEEEASTILRNGRREYVDAETEGPDTRIIASSLIAARGPRVAPEASVAKWLTAVAVIVLLVACTNVANLLLARAVRDRRENAVRLALGISRSRLILQDAFSAMLLALAGAGVALVFARLGSAFLRTTLLPDVAWGPALTMRVIAFSVAVGVIAGLVASVLPAWHSARQTPNETLRVRAGGITRSGARSRDLLTIVQAALSVVLLFGAGLFMRSLQRVRAVDLGFETRDVWLAEPVHDAASRAPAIADVDAVVERVMRIPGVRGVTAAQMAPFQGSLALDLVVEGMDSIPTPPSGGPYVYPVSEGYFETLGLDILEGRGFTAADRAGAPRVTVLSRSMAKRLWPAEPALGKCLYVEGGGDCTRVVGIAEDAHRQAIREDEQLLYYLPLRQSPLGSEPAPTLLIRAGTDRAGFAAEVRTEVIAGSPGLRHVRVTPFDALLEPQTRAWTLGAALFTAFGFLALLIASIGLYSVLAFDVAQRLREIGLRSALGAGRLSIVTIFLSRGLVLAGAGGLAGILLALALGPRIQSLLFETSTRDPVPLLGVPAVLILVAIAASAVPAWRAVRVEPTTALRSD